ncbi:phosphohydrolase [Marinitoga sp. 1135]|uniref:HDIG domain-containing metalloprotein n=1 Tax=unclassified Marinitoga TaxID=2640159 RepID=UPI001585D3C8|nr:MULTISPECIES: HDIG domain-containing metalloprotein [unclassified Marinitoga]NUU94728.1 phosphohydrolase [Marinitoga sp. 1135]NUU96657.1 phosphohydrolase [Marinitoga sp. 1138]
MKKFNKLKIVIIVLNFSILSIFSEIFLWKNVSIEFLYNSLLILIPFWFGIIEFFMNKNKKFKLHPKNYWATFLTVLDIGIVLNIIALKYYSDPAISPVFVTVMITLMMDFYMGLLISLGFSFYFALLLGSSFKLFIILFITGNVAAYFSKNLYSRVRIIIPAFSAIIVQIISYLLYYQFDYEAIPVISFSNFIQMLLILGVLPYLEYITRIYSDIGLLELGNLNHPLLRKLSFNASGTYYHSLIIANLVESASESINANPVLLRVGSYFHDIGKSLRPLFFTENQKGINPHDKINPKLSAIILNKHVTDGIELARKYRLPILIEDLIAQHHGTRIKRYFFHKNLEQELSIPAEEFRYPGPIPQFKESAILMIADNIEAITRSMKELNKKTLSERFDKLIQDLFFEGQLDDCGLTLSEINKIKDSMIETILNMNHSRISYPEIPQELLKEGNKNEN